MPELTDDEDDPAQASQHMQRMGGSEHIEERTAGIGRQIKALGAQLPPRDILAGHKEQAER